MKVNSTWRDLIAAYAMAMAEGNVLALEHCFHEDASIVGTHFDILISTDRSSYVRFLSDMGLGGMAWEDAGAEVIWEECRGKLGVVCMLEKFAGCELISYATMAEMPGGWKLITKSFHDFTADAHVTVHDLSRVKISSRIGASH